MTEETMVVLTTCGNDEDANALARALVEQRLAACVNAVSNVASTYRWKGEVQQDQETLLIIKTTAPRLAALEKAIREQLEVRVARDASRCPCKPGAPTISLGSGNR